MRFTRIPIIATLLAGALSLLFLLPAFGQTTSGDLERTEGRAQSGALQVGVFNDVADAQTARKKRVQYPTSSPTRIFYQNAASGATGTTLSAPANIGDSIADTRGSLISTDPAFLVTSRVGSATLDIPGNYVDTRNTFFNGSLYVSAKDKDSVGGYNTVLITLLADRLVNNLGADTACVAETAPNYPVAKVSNPSRGYTIDVPLVPSATNEDDARAGGDEDKAYLQAFFTVVDDNQSDADLLPADRRRDGPHCMDYTTANTTFGQIAARHGDRLTVRIANEPSNISLIVDTEGPEVNLISPVDASSVRPTSLSFRFDVRDPDSGLRHDGEYSLSDDGDAASVNPDNDAVRSGEPRSVATSSLFGGGNGKAADIQAVYWSLETLSEAPVGDRLALPDTTRADDITDQGTWSAIGGRAGVGYSFSARGNGFDDADNALQFTASDRVGNTTTSDADLEKSGNQPYIFRVDNTEPTVSAARTGISYDNAKNEEKVDRSSIALTFNEAVKSGDVVVSRITVAGNTVVGVVQPDGVPNTYRGEAASNRPGDCTLVDEILDTSAMILDTTATMADPDNPGGPMIQDPNAFIQDPNAMIPNPNQCPGTDIGDAKISDTRMLVYLQLGSPLAADEKPDVSLLSGAVQDLAGNDLDTVTVDALVEDWIAPTLTVSVTGTKGDRPIANKDGAFVVEVTSDEDLSGRPRVVFAQIVVKDNGATADPRYTYSIGDEVSSVTGCNLTPQETDNVWLRSCGVGEQIDSAITGLVGVFVLARDDEESNLAVSPVRWTTAAGAMNKPGHQASGVLPVPESTNAVDAQKLHDAGLLVEIDNVFNSDGGTLDDEGNVETAGVQKNPAESVTPQSGDDAKKTESANPFIHIDFDGEASEYGLGDFKDSHGTVTITEIKLDDEDATDRLSRVAKDEFSVVLRDLTVGKHTLTYKAEDDAGNEYNNGEFKFEVLQRKPYKVDVKPGWNLISLPGSPENADIANVLTGTEFLTPVLAYQDGDWLTARRADDGWDGRLTEIESGYGYWVHAQTFETVSTLLTEIDPASVPPTVPVARGWNLLGVIDVDQRPAGGPPGTGVNADGEADNYFNSIPWKVAYSYDTQRSVWQRYTPDADIGCRDDDNDAETAEVCDNEILNGSGYWVWSERPSTLVP